MITTVPADRRDLTLDAAFAGELSVRELADLAAAIARKTDSEPPPARLVCCYCTPHHVMREGSEPVSHGACPIGIAKFEAGDRA
jgi:hypothetical protein